MLTRQVRPPTAAWNCASAINRVVFDIAETGAQLRAGLVHFALPVDAEELAECLLLYLAELHKWNAAYNLTAVRDPRQMLPRHIYDSLSALPFMHGERIVDAGTGAGLPGIPLALCYPDRQFTLLDSNGKKIRFVDHVVRRLGLSNVTVAQARVEEYSPPGLFTAAVSRAFSSLRNFAAGTEHMLAPGARLVAMKGRFPADELATLEDDLPQWRLQQSVSLQVPELEGERHILVLERL